MTPASKLRGLVERWSATADEICNYDGGDPEGVSQGWTDCAGELEALLPEVEAEMNAIEARAYGRAHADARAEFKNGLPAPSAGPLSPGMSQPSSSSTTPYADITGRYGLPKPAAPVDHSDQTTTEAHNCFAAVGECVGCANFRMGLAKGAEEREDLLTVMRAAADEIDEHWDAHCYNGNGPVNLMRRLEKGQTGGGYPAYSTAMFHAMWDYLTPEQKAEAKARASKSRGCPTPEPATPVAPAAGEDVAMDAVLDRLVHIGWPTPFPRHKMVEDLAYAFAAAPPATVKGDERIVHQGKDLGSREELRERFDKPVAAGEPARESEGAYKCPNCGEPCDLFGSLGNHCMKSEPISEADAQALRAAVPSPCPTCGREALRPEVTVDDAMVRRAVWAYRRAIADGLEAKAEYDGLSAIGMRAALTAALQGSKP